MGLPGDATGMGLAGIMGVVGLTVAWMAFKGADILPQVTWMKQMSSTDNLSDTDAWMNTGITLAMQIVGGIVAYVLLARCTTASLAMQMQQPYTRPWELTSGAQLPGNSTWAQLLA